MRVFPHRFGPITSTFARTESIAATIDTAARGVGGSLVPAPVAGVVIYSRLCGDKADKINMNSLGGGGHSLFNHHSVVS